MLPSLLLHVTLMKSKTTWWSLLFRKERASRFSCILYGIKCTLHSDVLQSYSQDVIDMDRNLVEVRSCIETVLQQHRR